MPNQQQRCPKQLLNRNNHINTNPSDDKMATRKTRKPVIDCLVLSTSSGYSTASDEAEPSASTRSSTIAPTTHPTTTLTHPVQKSSKRKTRAPTAPIAPSQKRIKVESITNYNCNATSTTIVTSAAATDAMHNIGEAVLSSKPPLPPKATNNNGGDTRSNLSKHPKTKCHSDNQKQAMLLNKLSAYADQCRLEIADLKLALANEKAAVRSLR